LTKDVVERANMLRNQEEIDRMFAKFELPVR
jgi:LysR family cys regulon transcriptional activator